MTKTYLIHATCLRPFSSWIEIEAGTPEEALATARLKDSELLDAAERATAAIFGDDDREELWLERHHDMIEWDGCFYGDMEVFVAETDSKA